MRIIIVSSILLVVAAAFWLFPGSTGVTSENGRVYLQDGRIFQKIQVDFLLTEFNKKGIANATASKGKILIPKSARSVCNEIVGSAEFERLAKKESPSFSATDFFKSPGEKAKDAKSQKLKNLENILTRISGIREAIIVHDETKVPGFSRKTNHSALVTLWAKEGQVISQLHASTARRMVKQSFADMEENDVLVVDGDTGLTFSRDQKSTTDEQIVESQVDLETTKQEFEIQCKKLISQFGESEVKVRMDLEKRILTLPAQPTSPPANPTQADKSEVVANGKGEINKGVVNTPSTAPLPRQKTVLIKRLFGIDVSIDKKVVSDYIRQNLGGSDSISEEQFTRGIVSVRNEITKSIVLWLRSQQGIDVNSDIVRVAVIANEIDPVPAKAETTTAITPTTLYTVAGGILVMMLVVFVMATFKSRTPIRHQPTHDSSTRERPIRDRSPHELDGQTGQTVTGANSEAHAA